MAYDDAQRMTLLFGGGEGGFDPVRFDTWTWDGKSWSAQHPSAAPTSEGFIAYDEASGSLLLWDGSTYSWDGSGWIDLHLAHSPSSGIPAFMAYDAAHRAAVVVIVQGTGTSTTWTFSGTDWQQQHPVHQPSGPANATTAFGAYDAQRGVIVAFIGDQTWTWNGSDWTQQHPTRSPKQRFFASMAYDPALGKVMLFGGKIDGDPKQVNNELWAWDGTTWSHVA